MASATFLRWSGISLAIGGALTLFVNVVFTPQLPPKGQLIDVAATSLFAWRQSASAMSAAMLLFGSVGLYQVQAERAGRFGAVAFTLAFFGSALALCVEWSEVFLVRDLAFRAPDALRVLDAGHGKSSYDIGALFSIGAFALGWVLLSISSLRSGFSRWAAGGVIAGLFLNPLLAATLPGVVGPVLANMVLGPSLSWLGYDVLRRTGSARQNAA
jgi:hypothetical protein